MTITLNGKLFDWRSFEGEEMAKVEVEEEKKKKKSREKKKEKKARHERNYGSCASERFKQSFLRGAMRCSRSRSNPRIKELSVW